MENFVEQLVAEYYNSKGFLVSTNFWLPFKTSRKRTQNGIKQEYNAQSWTDIDVIARNENELHLVQVKQAIKSKELAYKIIEYYNRVDSFLKKGKAPDGITDIKWWAKGVKIRRIVIYEDKHSPPSYKKILNDEKIETIFFGDYFQGIISYIESKQGVKEESPLMRLIHFLKKEKMLTESKRKTRIPKK